MAMAVIDLAPGVTRGLVVPAELETIEAMLADRLGAEAATVVHGFPGAILVAVAACLTGERPGAVDRLPGGGGRIVLQRAHSIDLGCRLTQLLAVAGAEPVEIGAVDRTALHQLEAALEEGVAGALFVAGTGGGGLLELPGFLFAAHERQVPVVVAAPERADWTGLLDAGADLVVLDAATAFGGPGAGIVAGRPALVQAARLQRLGIGRLVQATPGLVAELAEALAVDRAALVEDRRDRVAARLAGIDGIVVESGDGGLVLVVDADRAGFTARDLAYALRRGEPAVLLDDRRVSSGRLVLDLSRPDEAVLERALLAIGACIEAGVTPAPWPPADG